MILNPDFKDFVKLLTENKVEYLIVGGYAVGIHGYPRYTGDLDIWINNTTKNAHRTLRCVEEFGFSSYNLSVSDFTKEVTAADLTLYFIGYEDLLKNKRETARPRDIDDIENLT